MSQKRKVEKKKVLAGKELKKSKTVLFNVLLMAAELSLFFIDVFPKETYHEMATGLFIVNGVVNIILRVYYTDTYIRDMKRAVE